MTGTGQQLRYQENRCALNWRFLTVGLYAPVVAIALVVASLVLGDQAFFWGALVFLIIAVVAWAAGSGEWVRYAWPAGIRLDDYGARIGGVRWAEKHPGRTRTRLAIVPRQYSQVFSCPWTGVLSVGVTTDRRLLAKMTRAASRGRKLTPLGNLALPFMRAALVITVDTAQASMPEIRPATSLLWVNFPEPGYRQPVWISPTRRPAQLEQALAALSLPPGTVRDPADSLAAG